ncbi:coiled-coil domain-containing protein 33-like isoform X1 [Styela clava]
MARSGRTSVKLEDKVLEFEFEILKVQFNKNGKFFLKLSVQNAHRTDLMQKVTVDINDSGVQQLGSQITTDTVLWSEDSNAVKYEKSKFKYNLPKGFCKNDGKYDVYLFIEVFRYPTDGRKSQLPERMGEAKFAIYPRTEIPRANLFVSKGEDYYKYSGVLTLLRPLTRASISMHCGRLSYIVAFHEYREPGFVYQPSDDEETTLSPVQEEPTPVPPSTTISQPPSTIQQAPTIKVSEPSPKEASRKANVLRQTNKQPQTSTVSPRSTERFSRLEKVRSVDRTTQWTPQEIPDIWSPDTLTTEGTFHLSVPSSPELEDSNHPSNRQKTMDSPGPSNLPPQPTRSTKSPPKKVNPKRTKSPTLTSPIPDREAYVLRPDHHVARPGYEEVYVIVHGATSLPSRSDGQDPLPFASLKSIADERGVRKAQSATHATLQATHSPTWEEILTMEVSEETADEEEVILTISDSASKEKLVTYRVALKNLIPFHPYHFELVQPTKSIGSGIRAYVTIQRRGSYLPRLHNFGFCGLEVVLRGLHRQLATPSGPLIAVARIVPDYTVYKERMLSKQSAGITTTTVTFPSPHPNAFEVSNEQMQGFPQLTTASTGSDQPSWDHTFMFCGNDTATMFNHNSALVIEYYPATSSMTTVTWTIRNPIGFSTLLLDDEVFRALTSESGRLGVRVEDLLVQSSRFRTLAGTFPSVDLVLRLIYTERPDSLATAAALTLLPSLDSMPIPGSAGNPLVQDHSLTASPHPQTSSSENPGLLDTEPSDLSSQQAPLYNRKKTQILVKEDEYPPSDILETILPEYVLTENDPNSGMDTRKRHPDKRSAKQPLDNNNSMSLVGHQSKELEHYREAVKRMASDISTLRSTVSKLQDENHSLRRELMMRKEVGDIVRNDISTGVVTTEEFADKFVAVKTKLDSEKGELKKYRDKVQHLQNLLIKANEREKKHLNETSQKKNQRDVKDSKISNDKLQKMKKLENTCVQQEKVIEKMEKLLGDYLKQEDVSRPRRNRKTSNEHDDSDPSHQVSTLLTQENARLRMELEEMKIQSQRDEAEKAQLQARLERAESRINSLENQLEQNSRRWAQERHELTVRLQEHRNGFMRTTAAVGDGMGTRDSFLLRESTVYSDLSSVTPFLGKRHRKPTPFVAPITSPRTLLPHIYY